MSGPGGSGYATGQVVGQITRQRQGGRAWRWPGSTLMLGLTPSAMAAPGAILPGLSWLTGFFLLSYLLVLVWTGWKWWRWRGRIAAGAGATRRPLFEALVWTLVSALPPVSFVSGYQSLFAAGVLQ